MSRAGLPEQDLPWKSKMMQRPLGSAVPVHPLYDPQGPQADPEPCQCLQKSSIVALEVLACYPCLRVALLLLIPYKSSLGLLWPPTPTPTYCLLRPPAGRSDWGSLGAGTNLSHIFTYRFPRSELLFCKSPCSHS